MSDNLFTVEQAAQRLNLHPKTVLRYIREGRLTATRLGKSYRILRNELDAFAGIAAGASAKASAARATAILEIPTIDVGRSERIATFLQATALSGDATTPPLHVQTAFDPATESMKIILIGTPADVGKLLEMLDVHTRSR
ncbi:helix-turn-helix domain-containing protein [Pelagibacterium limicola]|uniref:helix-turn-helix domain-containing protein n=1 Tax=Pelagibacterium limicola TaxID=2791022 RepID=UPI0018B01611|nr:helix-turn-helix domain-containing protein [Pelagibacterium limicola]